MPSARTAPDDAGTPGRVRTAVTSRFRLPGEDDPAPRTGRLLGLCVWAAALGFLGLIPGGRLAVALAMNLDVPSWYAPTALTIGVLGVAAIAAGFAAIHRYRLPSSSSPSPPSSSWPTSPSPTPRCSESTHARAPTGRPVGALPLSGLHAQSWPSRAVSASLRVPV
ncbi:hypothetical protein ACFQZ4_19435 [Catellatospora coxensis]